MTTTMMMMMMMRRRRRRRRRRMTTTTTIKAASDGTAMCNALRLPKGHLLFERLPGFSRLSFCR